MHTLQIDLDHGASLIVRFDDDARILSLRKLQAHHGLSQIDFSDLDPESQALVNNQILHYLFELDASK